MNQVKPQAGEAIRSCPQLHTAQAPAMLVPAGAGDGAWRDGDAGYTYGDGSHISPTSRSS
eukprot:COSAG03_NODE_14886_length_448_cov_1.323782_1_plen_59_part_10